MHKLTRLYQLINILSLDIVAGAVISALFFAKIFDVNVRVYGLIALGLTVWIIYTVDHLRDAKKIRHPASTKRHRFHQRNFTALIFFLCLAMVIDAITIFFIRQQVLQLGLILLIGVIIYLVVQRSLRFLKEFVIAGLYTCGILILSLSLTSIEVSGPHYFHILQFGLIAWINLVLFSWFDQHYDQKDEQNSFVTVAGDRITGFFLYGLCIFNYLLAVIHSMLWGFNIPVIILLMMNTVLFLIFFFREFLAQNDLYRLIGDAVFLLPIIFLIQ
ncbi:hypothetical protein [Chryseolinea sp. H1M3-3]|uniref:hypothetical protein n=1 Tax=Chryseolinea sp. H1M3-3 TaxID=3034144 RepID=UPI0023ED62A3|nr:hypothetical protein [Chryseolinea sp. H1M3-3]